MDIPNYKGRDSFWEAYQACTEENRVPSDRSPFFVNWAKTFTNFLPGKPLKDRAGRDIEVSLANLTRLGIHPRGSLHGRKLSKKHGSVKIVRSRSGLPITNHHTKGMICLTFDM